MKEGRMRDEVRVRRKRAGLRSQPGQANGREASEKAVLHSRFTSFSTEQVPDPFQEQAHPNPAQYLSRPLCISFSTARPLFDRVPICVCIFISL
jgi:hypothetical protein